ncbi:UNVERIFIED_ORG: hypothetical protein J2W38_004924 [Variovorax paradoxus]|nr:hypothetical protein [Variovorax paradoxus]
MNQDIAILQNRIGMDKGAGFNDMARLLESMSIQFFKAVGIADLKSKNQIRVNFPAIDAADDKRDGGVAVQVTSVADTRKIGKTIEAFEKKGANGKCLKDDYASLYIFGFCKTSKPANLPSYCQVVGPGFFVDKLVDLDDEEKVQLIINTVRNQVDYSSIHPYGDVDCLKIVLGYVNRSAVTHRMSCEGSIDAMTKGLSEISELIGRGTVSGRHKSKAYHEFKDQEIGEFLRDVLNQIGKIMAIVNHANRGGFVCLNQQDMKAIDERKRLIVTSAQNIAAKHDIRMSLSMHEVD